MPVKGTDRMFLHLPHTDTFRFRNFPMHSFPAFLIPSESHQKPPADIFNPRKKARTFLGEKSLLRYGKRTEILGHYPDKTFGLAYENLLRLDRAFNLQVVNTWFLAEMENHMNSERIKKGVELE